MKKIYMVLAVLLLALMSGVFAPAAFAASWGSQAPLPTDGAAILLMTVGALLDWLVTYGIAWAVGWLLGYFPQLGENTIKAIGGLLIVTLSAGAVYLIGFLTPAQLNLTVLQAVLAIVSAVVAWVGQLKGTIGGQIAFINVNEARGRVAQIRVGK